MRSVGDIGIVEKLRPRPLVVFSSYAPGDASLYDELDGHFRCLRSGHAVFRHVGDLGAGASTSREVRRLLDESDIIIVLVSVRYISSNEHYEADLERAMARHRSGEARLIPVIVRDCVWDETLFAELKPLPTGGRAVTLWPDRDQAWAEVTRGTRRMIDEIYASRSGG